MRSDRERFLPWLIKRIDSGEVPGLYWWNKEKTEFHIIWKHAGKPDFDLEKDAVLFRMWAVHTGKYKHGEQPDPSTWKTRFRCALRKQPDIIEIPIANSLDESEPFRVFRIKNTAFSSSRASRTSTVSPTSTPSPSPNDVMDMYSYNSSTYTYANDIGAPMTSYNPNYEIPFSSTESSPTSSPRSNTEINEKPLVLEDDDLDNINPTLPLLYSANGSELSMPFLESDSHMITTESSYTYRDRSDNLRHREPMPYGMYEGIFPEIQPTPGYSYNTGIQEQNGMAAQLGLLLAMFGPTLLQEMSAQQTTGFTDI